MSADGQKRFQWNEGNLSVQDTISVKVYLVCVKTDDDDSKGKKGRESDANSGILLDPALLVNPFDDQAGNDAGNTRSNHHRHAMRKTLWNRRWGSFGGDWQLPCTGDEEGNGHPG